MEKMESTWVSPVLSVLSAQGGRVTGKAAKERPKKDKKPFREFLHLSGHERQEEEREERLDTFA